MTIKRIWFTDERIYGQTEEGKTVWQSLLWYKHLKNATEEQRNEYEIDDEGIHWYDLDEDGIVIGQCLISSPYQKREFTKIHARRYFLHISFLLICKNCITFAQFLLLT